jgi:ABC-2 type transport system ATP-binding protein
MNAVTLENVCKSFGPVHAVDNLTVRVPVGSIYGFLGPNGAGKTTTLRMIMNIIRPDSGRIEILGDGRIEQVKDRIGYMPEERGLYRKMTARKVLAYFRAIKGLSEKEITHNVPRWLERIGLVDWADRKVEELSRGMHQKLQFVVTVVNDPELVILDEPFSGLDPLNQDLLKDIILKMRSEGKTVIFSTHVMHEAEKLCDFILLINKGKSILDGRLDEIRSGQSAHTVSIELEGDTGFVETLPMVTAVKSEGKRLEVILADADTQRFLQALMQRARVRAFEVKVPSLHEIFVNMVAPLGVLGRASDEENS